VGSEENVFVHISTNQKLFSQWQQHWTLDQKEIRTHFRSICSFGSNGWAFSYEKNLLDTIQSSCFPP
jgi:hypothetical protein